MVFLRDGRKLFAILRTFDQFGNLLLQDAYERFYVELEYAEEYRGVYLVRGENVVLVGELVQSIGVISTYLGRGRVADDEQENEQVQEADGPDHWQMGARAEEPARRTACRFS